MAKKKRAVELKRKTRETEILLKLNLDGQGKAKINSPLGFFNHLLEGFTVHSFFDLELKAKGDLEVDEHHLIEDLGLALGEAFSRALVSKKGINRFGWALVPMDEALARVVVDISSRPYLVYQVKIPRSRRWEFNVNLVEDFFRAFVNQAGVTLHIKLEYGKDYHHSLEAIFKAFGRAVSKAVSLNPRVKSLPSSKGKL